MRTLWLTGAMLALMASVVGAKELRGRGGDRPDRAADWSVPIDARAVDTARLAAAVFAETNRVREAAGLRAFRASERLDAAASSQADVGALMMVVSHDNPRRGMANVYERTLRAGLTPSLVAENLALTPLEEAETRLAGPGTSRPPAALTFADYARKVVEQWMDSPPHRANILNARLEYLGCSVRPKKAPNGKDVLYAVQVFFTPHRTER